VEYSDIESGDDPKDTTKIRRGPDTAERPKLLESDTGISDNTAEDPTEHEIAQGPLDAANCLDEDSTVNHQFHAKKLFQVRTSLLIVRVGMTGAPKRFLKEETDVHELSGNDVKGCSDDTGYSDTASFQA